MFEDLPSLRAIANQVASQRVPLEGKPGTPRRALSEALQASASELIAEQLSRQTSARRLNPVFVIGGQPFHPMLVHTDPLHADWRLTEAEEAKARNIAQAANLSGLVVRFRFPPRVAEIPLALQALQPDDEVQVTRRRKVEGHAEMAGLESVSELLTDLTSVMERQADGWFTVTEAVLTTTEVHPDLDPNDVLAQLFTARIEVDRRLVHTAQRGRRIKDSDTFDERNHWVQSHEFDAWLRSEYSGRSFFPTQVHAAEATPGDPDEIDRLADRDELIEAFGPALKREWFDKLEDWLLEARLFKGKGGRGGRKALFCPYRVMRGLTQRALDRMPEPQGWAVLRNYFPATHDKFKDLR